MNHKDPNPSLALPVITGNDEQVEEVHAHHVYDVLPRPIAVPVIYQAVEIFLADTVVPVPIEHCTSQGHFSRLAKLVKTSSSSDALPSALEAVALASFANRFRSSEVRTAAVRRYVACISQLRNGNLRSENGAMSILACILLLSMYEVSVGFVSRYLRFFLLIYAFR